jgi:putative transposase
MCFGARMRGSTSSPGNPYRNAQAQSVTKTIKVEQVDLAGCESLEDVTTPLPKFIDEAARCRLAAGGARRAQAARQPG